jgi:hypothetical protein
MLSAATRARARVIGDLLSYAQRSSSAPGAAGESFGADRWCIVGFLMRRRCLAALVASAMLACASGPPRLAGQPIRKPLAVLVRVSADAAKTDELGGTAGIVDAVERGLAERGVRYQLFAADDDRPPAPRIEIWVQKWDAGDRGERLGVGVAFGLVGLLAAGGYVVVLRVYRDGEAIPAVEETYRGSILGTDEDASISKGESVGEDILDDAFRKP